MTYLGAGLSSVRVRPGKDGFIFLLYMFLYGCNFLCITFITKKCELHFLSKLINRNFSLQTKVLDCIWFQSLRQLWNCRLGIEFENI